MEEVREAHGDASSAPRRAPAGTVLATGLSSGGEGSGPVGGEKAARGVTGKGVFILQSLRIGQRSKKWQRKLKERAEVEGDGSETRAEGSSQVAAWLRAAPRHPTSGSAAAKKPAPLPWLIFLRLPFSPLCPGLNPPANSKEQAGII